MIRYNQIKKRPIMHIELLPATAPSDTAVSAARTCYYPGGIVRPEQSRDWARKSALLEGVFKAGHHTTLMHSHLTLLISGISRHLIWRLLHAHPYYNSEQVSQRYAKMKIENFVYPEGAERAPWEAYYADQYAAYEQLIEILLPDVERLTPKFRRKDAPKKAQEMARYVLPGGMSAYLYHTVNVVTLLRYIAAAKALPECGCEAQIFADLLSEKLLALDPQLAPLVDEARASTPVFPTFDIPALKSRLGMDDDVRVRVYDIVGDAAFDVNANYADVLRYSQLFGDAGVLGGFSSYLRLSLSADAQNQRHRRSPAVRPALASTYARRYYTPPVIAANPEALRLYREALARSYHFFESQRTGLGFGEAVYALCNAHDIEIIERNDFAAFHHKAQMRLCYNAQEEIYDLVYAQVRQLRDARIPGADALLPPCSVRHTLGIHPICPEGERFCGVKVWKLDFDDFERKL